MITRGQRACQQLSCAGAGAVPDHFAQPSARSAQKLAWRDRSLCIRAIVGWPQFTRTMGIRDRSATRRASAAQHGSPQQPPPPEGSQEGAGESEAEARTRSALELAHAALAEAQVSAENLQRLPSAQEPWQMPAVVRRVAKPLAYAAVLMAVWASHAATLPIQIGAALMTVAAIGLQGVRRGSLNLSGAVAAAAVGTANLGSSLRCGATLLGFFFASSKLTRYAEDRKDNDEAFKPGGQRNWKQVLCNALVPSALAVLQALQTGGRDSALGATAMRQSTQLLGGVLGYYACCCGDTWGSEVGQLSEEEPRLITTGRPVRPGTNGGVTMLGLAASAAGGAFIGFVFWASAVMSPALLLSGTWRSAASQWQLMPLGLAIGLVGSLIDSLLGATVQFTGVNRKTGKLTSKYSSEIVAISGIPLLSNNAVNFVSATACAILASRAALAVF